MDILSFLPEEIKTIIFDFLPLRDLLNLSSTSTYWYNYIAENIKCMNRITFVLSENNRHVVHKFNGLRPYKHLRIELWSSLDNNCLKELTYTLNVLSHNLRSITTNVDIPITFDLPHLIEINFDALNENQLGSFEITANGLLYKSKKIEKLFISESNDEYAVHINRFLENSHHLKSLSIYNASFLTDYTTNKYPIKLQCFIYTGHSPMVLQALQFLKDNRESIVKIQYGDILSFDELILLLSFPKLYSLQLLRLSFEAHESESFPLNYSITRLTVDGYYENANNLNMVLVKLLRVLKILKFLKISHFDASILQSIFNSLSLKKVEFNTIHNASLQQKLMILRSERIIFICSENLSDF